LAGPKTVVLGILRNESWWVRFRKSAEKALAKARRRKENKSVPCKTSCSTGEDVADSNRSAERAGLDHTSGIVNG
jgi:hypothetical protein